MNSQVINNLNVQLANWNLLFVKLHNYHWNVKGEHFFTLHEKFEELYDEAKGHIDEVAERILALGAVPAGTLKEILELASLSEATGKENPREMVETIVADFKTVVSNAKAGIEIAGDAGDDTSVDLLTQVIVALEKHVWLFSAFLG